MAVWASSADLPCFLRTPSRDFDAAHMQIGCMIPFLSQALLKPWDRAANLHMGSGRITTGGNTKAWQIC